LASTTPPGAANSFPKFGLPVCPANMFVFVREGTEPGRAFPLNRNIVRLGRSAQHADLVLSGDARLSRRHATIVQLARPGGRHYILIDEGSKNGVLVNNRRVDVHCLTPCDTIRIGGTVLEFVPEELLPVESDIVTLEPLSVPSDVDRSDFRKPGEVY